MIQREDSSHLLYVDPDPVYRQEVSSIFESTWTVTTAESAAEGAEAIDGSVDCIVAVDQLPETGGLDFFQSIQSDAGETPFVLFAAEEDVDLLRQAFRTGVTDVIYKQRSPRTGPEATPKIQSKADSKSKSETDISDTPTVCDHQSSDAVSDITDGIVGLRNCLNSLEIDHTDLDGITLDVSRSLMGAAADEVDMKTEWALQSLAEQINAKRCLIYESDSETEMLEQTHGWISEDASSTDIHRGIFRIGAEEVPADAFPGFGSQLQQFEPVCLDATMLDTAALGGKSTTEDQVAPAAGTGETASTTVKPADAEEAVAVDAEAGTLLALPIVIEWQLSGAIVITVDEPREWTESARQRLQAVGELVGHMERRRRRRQELERQNEQLEQFASVISHDLQNPLNVISGYLDLTLETEDLDRLDPAVSAADRMEALLDDLLTLAREGRAVGETEKHDLEKIVLDAWDSVETHEAALDVVGFEEFEPVMADETRLKEAFENLFRNAIVHVGKDVNMRVKAADGTIVVSDDGPGIPPDKRSTVFEYGYTSGNGTGLGLAIIRSIIEGHDWEISAGESEDGGARFDIELDR